MTFTLILSKSYYQSLSNPKTAFVSIAFEARVSAFLIKYPSEKSGSGSRSSRHTLPIAVALKLALILKSLRSSEALLKSRMSAHDTTARPKNLLAIIYVPKNELMTTQNRNINLKTLRKANTNAFIHLLKFSLKFAQNYISKLRYRVKFSAVNSIASKICR